MNLRLAANSIRFRLDPPDVVQLRENLWIEQRVAFSETESFFYRLEVASVASVHIQTETKGVRLLVPQDQFLFWLESSEMEFDTIQPNGTASGLRISVEKDIKTHSKKRLHHG